MAREKGRRTMANGGNGGLRRWATIAAGVGVGLVGARVARDILAPRLDGQATLIVGASRGLGLALAEEFARQGARIAICARDAEELAEAARLLGERGYDARAIQGDAADADDAPRIVAEATALLGRIDILVNVAGIISVGPALAQSLDDLERVMQDDFWSAAQMTYATLPQMLERHAGRIVNIASIGGRVSVPHLLGYSSAKFALVGFSEGLRAELLREGVVVTTVCPGLMRTGSYLNAQFRGTAPAEVTLFSLLDNTPLASISAERAARQIVAATRRGAAELTISLPAVLLTAAHGLFPGLTTDLLGVVDSLLPGRPTPGDPLRYGSEELTSLMRSPLLALGQAAARRLNQRPAIIRRDGGATADEATGSQPRPNGEAR